MIVARHTAPLLVLVLGIAPAACSSDDTGSEGNPSDAGSGVTFAQSDCGKCVAQACGSEAQACAGDAQCAAWLTCLQSCPTANGTVDPACASKCAPPASGPGGDAQKAFALCMDQGAGAACTACGKTNDAGAPDGGADAANCPPSASSDPCIRCAEERCCEATASCTKNPECLPLGACYAACSGDPACQLKCVDDYPGGVAGWGHLQACQTVSCSGPDDCNGPPCTQCVANKCGSAYDACWSTPECYRFAKCFLTCPAGDSQCVTACQQVSPNGVAKFDVFVQCQLDQCGSEC